MSKKLAQLTARRESLVAKVAEQRNTLGETIEPWRMPLARVDQGLAIVRYFRQHPVLIVGAGLVIAALPLGRAGKWASRGWMVWQMVNKLRSPTDRAESKKSELIQR